MTKDKPYGYCKECGIPLPPHPSLGDIQIRCGPCAQRWAEERIAKAREVTTETKADLMRHALTAILAWTRHPKESNPQSFFSYTTALKAIADIAELAKKAMDHKED